MTYPIWFNFLPRKTGRKNLTSTLVLSQIKMTDASKINFYHSVRERGRVKLSQLFVNGNGWYN